MPRHRRRAARAILLLILLLGLVAQLPLANMSSAEVGLLDFLGGKKRRAKKADQVERTADAAIKASEASGLAKVKEAAATA